MADDVGNKLDLAHGLTIAWLSNPHTRANAEEVSAFMTTMMEAVGTLTVPPPPPTATQVEEHVPAVSVRKSLASRDHIISMVDGKPYRALKRHLSANGLTPEQYRERYGLRADYPMTAASYSEARSASAKQRGLGRKPGEKAPTKVKEGPSGKRSTKTISEAKKAAQAHLGTDGS